MNDYSQNSYRQHEYFSVSRGPLFANGKHKILINEGAIRHFAGKAQVVTHGIEGIIDYAEVPQRYYQDYFLTRSDLGAKNQTIIVPREEYNSQILVGDGDKLYLKCSSTAISESLTLPIIDSSGLPDFSGGKSMEIRINYFNDFDASYSVETDYLSSFESDELTGTFNFLIAEFSKVGKRLIKKQRHSGILFLPRVFKMLGEFNDYMIL